MPVKISFLLNAVILFANGLTLLLIVTFDGPGCLVVS